MGIRYLVLLLMLRYCIVNVRQIWLGLTLSNFKEIFMQQNSWKLLDFEDRSESATIFNGWSLCGIESEQLAIDTAGYLKVTSKTRD